MKDHGAMQRIVRELAAIVGDRHVSDAAEERYLYGRDMGTMPPAPPDMVVLPGTTAEVQAVVRLANRERVPLVPMGAGLVLSGLTRALAGGIVVDLKRMNRVVAVNDVSRYAVVEAGTSQGMLQAYLKKHHPTLKHSLPDAPPMATIGGNVLIHGSGHMSCAYGFHSDMLNGLEVVLPTGEVARIGSCAVSDYWFARAPLPDLAGLFLGWAGTTGIVTRLAIKLFPRYPFNDVAIFVADDPAVIPDVLGRLTAVQVAEDMTAWMTPKPAWAAGHQHVNICWGGHSREELICKRDLLRAAVRDYIQARTAGFMPLPPPLKKRFTRLPDSQLTTFADVRKGGGFEYVGAIMPVDLFAAAYRLGVRVAEARGVAYSLGARIIGANHCMMFFFAYAFNRADDADVARAQGALEETNREVIALGGIPWKAEAPAQQAILARMDPSTRELMARLRRAVDPNGIMNPGNWETER
jgi:glycolate oxidase